MVGGCDTKRERDQAESANANFTGARKAANKNCDKSEELR
jgi:hypothetical protein